jgi:hypothetical protein
MNSKNFLFALAVMIIGVAFGLTLAKPSQAQSAGTGAVTATSQDGKPACWVLLGNKLYFVERDNTSVLKVSASGVL